MTIAEANRFYNQDEHLYELATNKAFLCWLKDRINHGYHCYLEIDELQELINNITTWYEMKYPERELEFYEGIKYMDFQDIKKISNGKYKNLSDTDFFDFFGVILNKLKFCAGHQSVIGAG